MEKRNNNFEFDFTPIGQAIKQVRKAKGMTGADLSEIIDYVPRHIQAIENAVSTENYFRHALDAPLGTEYYSKNTSGVRVQGAVRSAQSIHYECHKRTSSRCK